MPSYEESIRSNYGQPDLGNKLLVALQGAGFDIESLTRDNLALFEDLHARGREATRELAQLVGLHKGMSVLDVGCGIGGPARTLAAEYGCSVTGIDLTEEFCRAAEILTARTGLSDKVTIRHGNALEMPFDNEVFDIVWTQFATGHIEDKERLFGQIRRVLRQGGRLATSEPCAGPGGPLHYPVAGADDSSVHFLLSPEAYRAVITASGFKELTWKDVSRETKERSSSLVVAGAGDAPPPLGSDLLYGPDLPRRRANALQNAREGRTIEVQGVFERAEPSGVD